MKLRTAILTLSLILVTGNSWASGPGDLTSPALIAYLFIYTCILAIAGVLVGGLYLAGRRNGEQSGHSHQVAAPHLNRTGQYHPGNFYQREAEKMPING